MLKFLPISLIIVGCSENGLNAFQSDDGLGGEESGDDLFGDDSPAINDQFGGVTGRICAPSEESWIVGAEVWIDDGDVQADTTTDADGYFVLDGVPPGTYTVHVQKGSFSTEFEVTIEANELLELAEEECLDDDDVRIAVVYGAYDSIELVLNDLGFDYDGYDDYDVSTFLSDPDMMAEYDIIFLNCGINDSWTLYESTIANNIKDYVQNGGSIYASDWAYYFTEASYPNMLDFYGDDNYIGDARVADSGELNAHVLDGDMVATLGSEYADLNYDLPQWVLPLSAGSGTALITGTASYSTFDYYTFEYITEDVSAVLAARQYDGDGQVLYTSFHNEAQTTWHMDLLLQEIIFSL